MDESFVASGLEKKQMWRPLRIDSAYLPSRLLQQFLVAAAVTIFCSMTLLAYAVSQSLQSSLTITAAEEGALLVDLQGQRLGFIRPGPSWRPKRESQQRNPGQSLH